MQEDDWWRRAHRVFRFLLRPAKARDLEVLRLLVDRTLSSPEIRGIPPERMRPMQEAIVIDMARLATTGSTLVAEAGGPI